MTVEEASSAYLAARIALRDATRCEAAAIRASTDARRALGAAVIRHDVAQRQLIDAIAVAGCSDHQPVYDPQTDEMRCQRCGLG